MQHLRSLAHRFLPHVHDVGEVDVPPISPEEQQMHRAQGMLADAVAIRIKARVDRFEADMAEGLEDLRREADLATGEAFAHPAAGADRPVED